MKSAWKEKVLWVVAEMSEYVTLVSHRAEGTVKSPLGVGNNDLCFD